MYVPSGDQGGCPRAGQETGPANGAWVDIPQEATYNAAEEIVTEIVKMEHHDLVVAGGDHVAAFFLPECIGDALQEAGVTPRFIISELAEILKTNRLTVNDKGEEKYLVSPRERMIAAKMLLEVAEKSAKVSGLIERITGHTERELPDGTRITMDAEGLRLLREGSSRTRRTLDVLRDHIDGPTIIDVEVVNANGRGDTGSIGGPIGTSECDGGGRRSNVAGDQPGCSSGGGDELFLSGHDEKRPDSAEAESPSTSNDQGSIGGAEDERESRLSEQSGRSSETKEIGGGYGCDAGGDRENPGASEWWNTTRSPATILPPCPQVPPRPYVPGGITTRADVGSSASGRDTRTPTSITDRLRTLYTPRPKDGTVVKRAGDTGGTEPNVSGLESGSGKVVDGTNGQPNG